MFSATVTVDANARSLRNLVNAAIANEIPIVNTGRAYQVILIASAATVILSSRGDITTPAPPPAGNGVALVANVPISFQAPTGNQIAVDEIFLSGAGTVGVMILVM